MNLNLGKFCLLFCCIVPIILPASSPDLEKLAAADSYQMRTISPQNLPAGSREKFSDTKPSSQDIRNLSDITAKQIVATALHNRSQFRAISNDTANQSRKRKRVSSSNLSDSKIQKIFAGYTPGKNRNPDTFSETSSISAEIIKASFKKDPTILTIPELIRNSEINRLERECKLAAHLNDRNKKINEIANGRMLVKALSVATPLMTAYVLTKSDPQSRFGIVAATSILSALPTIAGALGTLFIMWKIDKALHYGADILRTDMMKFRDIDKKEVAKQVQEINKAIQKEVADRIQGDQDVRKQNLTSLEKGTKDLELKLTSMSHNLELTQLDIDHARNDLSTMAPQVHTSLQNTAELKGFLASQIFPTLQSIQSQVTTMRQNEEAKNYSNPLADNIAYHINKDAVEHKSDTPPATIQRSDGIKLRQSKSPVPLISAESFFGQNASAFQNQFRSPKPASSTGAVADATIKDTPTGQASRTTQIVQNVQNYFWGSSAAKAAQNQK